MRYLERGIFFEKMQDTQLDRNITGDMSLERSVVTAKYMGVSLWACRNRADMYEVRWRKCHNSARLDQSPLPTVASCNMALIIVLCYTSYFDSMEQVLQMPRSCIKAAQRISGGCARQSLSLQLTILVIHRISYLVFDLWFVHFRYKARWNK